MKKWSQDHFLEISMRVGIQRKKMIKNVFTTLLLVISIKSFGQSSQVILLEKGIGKVAYNAKFEKQMIDLNNDGSDDLVYFYVCGEPNCIKVYLNIEGYYKEQISEFCSSHKILTIDNQKLLILNLFECCGESPYFSTRIYEFNKNSANLKENFILTNESYVTKSEMLTPIFYSKKARMVKVTINDYNLRFSPSLEGFTAKNEFVYGCEKGTNVITKIRMGAKIKVLSELNSKDRIWLFVEVEAGDISTCSHANIFFKEQKIRGWVSDKYVEKL